MVKMTMLVRMYLSPKVKTVRDPRRAMRKKMMILTEVRAFYWVNLFMMSW
jgi:hypothetical protein